MKREKKMGKGIKKVNLRGEILVTTPKILILEGIIGEGGMLVEREGKKEKGKG